MAQDLVASIEKMYLYSEKTNQLAKMLYDMELSEHELMLVANTLQLMSVTAQNNIQSAKINAEVRYFGTIQRNVTAELVELTRKCKSLNCVQLLVDLIEGKKVFDNEYISYETQSGVLMLFYPGSKSVGFSYTRKQSCLGTRHVKFPNDSETRINDFIDALGLDVDDVETFNEIFAIFSRNVDKFSA